MFTKNGGGDHKWRLSRMHYIYLHNARLQCTLEKQGTVNHVIKAHNPRVNVLNIASRPPWGFPWNSPNLLSYLSCRFKIHASDSIANIRNGNMILFTLSNLWNMFIWKSLFTFMFDAGVPSLHSTTIMTSSRLHDDVLSGEDCTDLNLETSINNENNSAS